VKQGGFTLLELVLVCAIIVMMIAMLLPSLYEAKKQSQRVACRVAIRSYAVSISEKTGGLVIEIPQEANCHQCHKPRYNAQIFLETLEK
tara:strand:- start:430 stop:696 length:267 start_codon:yes stop_codon:yes gene_type:complete